MQKLHPYLLEKIARHVAAENRRAFATTSQSTRRASKYVTSQMRKALCHALELPFAIMEYFHTYPVNQLTTGGIPQKATAAKIRAHVNAMVDEFNKLPRPFKGPKPRAIVTSAGRSVDDPGMNGINISVDNLFFGYVNKTRVVVYAQLFHGRMQLHVDALPRILGVYRFDHGAVVDRNGVRVTGPPNVHIDLNVASRAICECASALRPRHWKRR